MISTEEVVKLHDNGLKIGHIAMRLNMSYLDIARILRCNSRSERGAAGRKPLSKDQIWLAGIYWRSGYDTQAISEKLGVSESRVANARIAIR